jgi:hypothetical protein
MHAENFMGRWGFARKSFLRLCLCGWVMAGALSGSVQAAVIVANAQLTGVSLGRGLYSYTLTLNNSASSTSDIQMFWFGWEAGQADFLASQPASIETPAGWSAVVEGGGGDDGYSVQFVTFTSPLVPGSSLTFTFKSPDSPAVMAGPAELYPQYPTLTSQVYSAHEASGVQDVFVAQVVAPVQTKSLGTLSAQAGGSNLVLKWSAGTNVVLQQSSNLSATNWTAVAGTLGAGSFTVTNASRNPATFYRLAAQ